MMPPSLPSPPGGEGVLRVSGLTVESVRGRSLVEVFHDASLDLPAGEVVLLVGPSGSGKSLFTKLLAGLVGTWTDGLRIAPTAKVEVNLKDGRSVSVLESAAYPQELRGAVGYMFQYHALFDELTVEENVRFGADQARTPLRGKEWQDWLAQASARVRLERLLASPIDPLSGGQRQRASLLRMLALRPEVLIYDEPTSGLDPESAHRVAELISETQRSGSTRLSVVVTHDYANLLRVADRIVVLDPSRRFTVHETRTDEERQRLAKELPELFAKWESAKGRTLDASDARRIRDDAAWRRLISVPAVVKTAIAETPRVYARSWRWHLRFLWTTFRLLVLDAIPFTALGGAAVGLVLAWFSLNAVPQALQAQAEPVFIEEILRGMGMGLYQVLAPLFAAICLSARSGAAVSGHVSNLERTSQLDALRVLAVPPFALLGDKVVVSFAVGMPLLAAVTFISATLSSLAVVLLTRPLATWYSWKASFFQNLGQGPWDLPYTGTGWLLAKLVPAGIVCGLIAWREGSKPKTGSEDVNRAITRTIMQGILAVLAVFFVVLVLEIRR